ncbi:hypothetical protein ACJX0J_032689, partial [Zea mays]
AVLSSTLRDFCYSLLTQYTYLSYCVQFNYPERDPARGDFKGLGNPAIAVGYPTPEPAPPPTPPPSSPATKLVAGYSAPHQTVRIEVQRMFVDVRLMIEAWVLAFRRWLVELEGSIGEEGERMKTTALVHWSSTTSRGSGKSDVERIFKKVFEDLSDKNTGLLDINSRHVATLMVY